MATLHEDTLPLRRHRNAALLVAATAVLGAVACPAADTAEQLHPGTVTEAVRNELYQRDLIEWSDQLARQLDEADVKALMTALDVFLRAGQPERISRAIEKLGARKSGRLHAGGFWPERLLELQYYTQARQWFDGVEQNPCDRNLVRAFIRNWEATGDLDELEVWLKTKADGDNPPGGKLPHQWADLYYEYLARWKKLPGHVDGLAKQVRENPSQREPILRYLAARRHLDGIKPALDWLGKIAEPAHALDAFELARMMGDEQIESTIRLLDRSLTLPVTDHDRQWFNKRSMCAAYFPPDEVETTLRRWTKGRLAWACFVTKKLDRAQKLVEELTGKKDGTLDDLGPLQFAGQVQAASGQRVVEGRIKQAEELQKDSERYWLARAEYYMGRKENGEAEKAYKRALALEPGPDRPSVINDYGDFLIRLGRFPEAEALFRSEFERVVGGESSDPGFWIQHLRNLEGEEGVTFAWNDPLMWQWLALRRRSYFGQQAQWNLAWCWEKADDQRPAFWAKAEAMAGETPPASVDYLLARLLAQEGNNAEAAKRMAAAWARWTNNDSPSRHQAGSKLMGLYVDQGNWKEAEKVLLSLRDVAGFGGSDERDWLARLAIAAARADSKGDAMRLWQQRANQDLTDQRGLSELASHGLREQLATYYGGLAQRAPGNRAIAAALEVLAESGKP